MHQAANVIYLFERAQGPGRVVSVWVESTEQMIAGALIAQRLNKTESRKAALGASKKKPNNNKKTFKREDKVLHTGSVYHYYVFLSFFLS